MLSVREELPFLPASQKHLIYCIRRFRKRRYFYIHLVNHYLKNNLNIPCYNFIFRHYTKIHLTYFANIDVRVQGTIF